MKKKCPVCFKGLWATEDGLANHVWHDHPESKICMRHGSSSRKYGNPDAQSCGGRIAMASCALRIAQEMPVAAMEPRLKTRMSEGVTVMTVLRTDKTLEVASGTRMDTGENEGEKHESRAECILVGSHGKQHPVGCTLL